jgi:hypothetical protein
LFERVHDVTRLRAAGDISAAAKKTGKLHVVVVAIEDHTHMPGIIAA